MKKVIGFVLALMMLVFALTACAPSAPAETEDAEDSTQPDEETADQEDAETSEVAEEELHLVFVTPLIAHPVWLIAKEGFEDAAADFNFRGDWVGPNVISAEEMIKQIETAIVEKADGIITQGINPEAMVPVLEKCAEAGIPVVVTNSDIPDAPRMAYLGTDPKNLGNTGAAAILEEMGDAPIKAAYMTAVLDYKVGLDMIEGYEEVLETAPGGYEKMTIAEEKGDMLVGVQQWEYIFNTYPDTNVAVNVTASGAAAAAKVVAEKGLEDQVLIMAIDDIEETIDGIESGAIYGTMTQNFYRKGYQAAQWICDYVRNGVEPPALLNDSGTMLVTSDNLETYGEDMKKPETW